MRMSVYCLNSSNVDAVITLDSFDELFGVDALFGVGCHSCLGLFFGQSIGTGQQPAVFEFERSSLHTFVDTGPCGVISI